MPETPEAIRDGGGVSPDGLRLLCISVGNTNTKYGLFHGREMLAGGTHPSERIEEVAQGVVAQARAGDVSTCVMASVNGVAASTLSRMLAERLGRDVYRIGVDVPIPLRGRLDHEAMTGHDRALNALAAYEIMQQAVVVVDAGTAMTVDFVDGEGIFHGGAIAPGVSTALRALHAYTSSLPEVAFERPADHPFGTNTQQAMLNGVFYGARGMVRILMERYAEAYGGYPAVVATGGDASVLFGDDEMIDRVVGNLTLLGIAIACEQALDAEEE